MNMRQYITAGIIAIGAILMAFVIGNAYKYKFRNNETVVVTGLAEKEFTSDKVVWSGDYSRKNLDLKAAYASVKQDEATIRNYLKNKGINDNELVFSSVGINKDFTYQYDASGRQTGSIFSGYSLRQTISVESKDIDKIEKISREVTELIESGIEFNSSSPAFFYSKLSDLKLDLLAKASEDARKRAETIAKNTGGKLGKVKKANMGVFQITGKDSNEDYTEGGVFNTSSRDKKASITMKVEYEIE
jgi:uncharacterized protein